VLDALVDRQQHQGAVARPELEEEPVKAGPFAGGKLGKKRFLLGQGVDCHAFSSSKWVSPEYAIGAAPRAGRRWAAILG